MLKTLLCLALLATLVACGGGSPDDADSAERNTLPVGCLSAGCAK